MTFKKGVFMETVTYYTQEDRERIEMKRERTRAILAAIQKEEGELAIVLDFKTGERISVSKETEEDERYCPEHDTNFSILQKKG